MSVNVRFLKYHSWGSKGQTTNVSQDIADQLVRDKYAVIVPEDPKPATEPKPKRRRTKPDNKALSASE